MQLERNTAWQWPQPGATFPEKPDSGHTDTISTTARVGPGQLERHETPDPVRSNALNVRFHDVRSTGHAVYRPRDNSAGEVRPQLPGLK